MLGEETPNFAISLVCAKVLNDNPDPELYIDFFKVPDGLDLEPQQVIKNSLLKDAKNIYKHLRQNTTLEFKDFEVGMMIATDLTFYPDDSFKLAHRLISGYIDKIN